MQGFVVKQNKDSKAKQYWYYLHGNYLFYLMVQFCSSLSNL